MRIQSSLLVVCSVIAFALALGLVNRAPAYVVGIMFGTAFGCLIVLYAKRDHRTAT
jgi:hypothetical protein